MSFWIVFFAAAIAGTSLVALVIVWSTNRALQGAITRHFQDSEFILEHRQPPPKWLRTRWGRRANKTQIMSRLDTLLKFFENCEFFDSDESRGELLNQLRQERERWRIELPR